MQFLKKFLIFIYPVYILSTTDNVVSQNFVTSYVSSNKYESRGISLDELAQSYDQAFEDWKNGDTNINSIKNAILVPRDASVEFTTVAGQNQQVPGLNQKISPFCLGAAVEESNTGFVSCQKDLSKILDAQKTVGCVNTATVLGNPSYASVNRVCGPNSSCSNIQRTDGGVPQACLFTASSQTDRSACTSINQGNNIVDINLCGYNTKFCAGYMTLYKGEALACASSNALSSTNNSANNNSLYEIETEDIQMLLVPQNSNLSAQYFNDNTTINACSKTSGTGIHYLPQICTSDQPFCTTNLKAGINNTKTGCILCKNATNICTDNSAGNIYTRHAYNCPPQFNQCASPDYIVSNGKKGYDNMVLCMDPQSNPILQKLSQTGILLNWSTNTITSNLNTIQSWSTQFGMSLEDFVSGCASNNTQNPSAIQVPFCGAYDLCTGITYTMSSNLENDQTYIQNMCLAPYVVSMDISGCSFVGNNHSFSLFPAIENLCPPQYACMQPAVIHFFDTPLGAIPGCIKEPFEISEFYMFFFMLAIIQFTFVGVDLTRKILSPANIVIKHGLRTSLRRILDWCNCCEKKEKMEDYYYIDPLCMLNVATTYNMTKMKAKKFRIKLCSTDKQINMDYEEEIADLINIEDEKADPTFKISFNIMNKIIKTHVYDNNLDDIYGNDENKPKLNNYEKRPVIYITPRRITILQIIDGFKVLLEIGSTTSFYTLFGMITEMCGENIEDISCFGQKSQLAKSSFYMTSIIFFVASVFSYVNVLNYIVSNHQTEHRPKSNENSCETTWYKFINISNNQTSNLRVIQCIVVLILTFYMMDNT